MDYTHTIVGIFHSDFDAQDAVDSLLDKGFSRSDIEVRNQRDVNGGSTGLYSDKDKQEEKKESGLTSFFKTIFGNDDDVSNHSRLAEAGGAIVTVFAKSEADASRVADILDDKGAVDVNERASRFIDVPYGDPESVSGSSFPVANTGYDYDSQVVTKNESEYNTSRNLGRQTDEDADERQRREQTSGPGVGSNASGGMRSKSRINQWRGEASSSLRADRDAETKVGW